MPLPDYVAADLAAAADLIAKFLVNQTPLAGN
jgi:hypothetical protein